MLRGSDFLVGLLLLIFISLFKRRNFSSSHIYLEKEWNYFDIGLEESNLFFLELNL